MKSDRLWWSRVEAGGTTIKSNYPDAYGNAVVGIGKGLYAYLYRKKDKPWPIKVTEECSDKDGEWVHRTYWLPDPLALACFLSDKEQVHGQAGTGEQATYRGLPGTGDDPRPDQGG